MVYGDIGTSPLYALRECFGHVAPTPDRVLGAVSLIFWALVLVVGVKYLGFVLRADNRGEGGVLALLTLARRRRRGAAPRWLLPLGLAGAALFYADSAITPAISVLSAVQGLETAAPALQPAVVPIALVLLAGLFAVQHRGTGRIGALFGPVTLAWFVAIAVAGGAAIVRAPAILAAADPRHAAEFLAREPAALAVLGAVVLAVTGAEALFADLGHFGTRPIRLAWWAVAMPALCLSYFGQGAHLLARGAGPVGQPFFDLLPTLWRWPMTALATAATIVASQAVITGAASLTRQAIQLGYLPRLAIRHTSTEVEGRIHVPAVNALLALACGALVLAFRDASSLAAAYGVAVTGTMTITVVLYLAAMRPRLGWPAAAALGTLFLAVDGTFLVAVAAKIPHGGWLALVVAAVVLAVMASWHAGAGRLREALRGFALPFEAFRERLRDGTIGRVPGHGVFLAPPGEGAPPLLVAYATHARVLPERIFLLTLVTEPEPRVDPEERLTVEPLAEGLTRLVARYGYAESPDVGALLHECEARGLLAADQATIFLGRSSVVLAPRPAWRGLSARVFEFLHRLARPAHDHYRCPARQVVEIGARIEL